MQMRITIELSKAAVIVVLCHYVVSLHEVKQSCAEPHILWTEAVHTVFMWRTHRQKLPERISRTPALPPPVCALFVCCCEADHKLMHACAC